jgi:ketosteroid isomerase-like protein
MGDATEQGRNRRVLTRLAEILFAGDVDALGEVLTDDVITDMPQTAERIRGLEKQKMLFSANPGEEPGYAEHLQILGDEPRYVMTPTFNLVRVEGTGDHPVAVAKIHYPDGSDWWLVAFATMRGDKIAHMVSYWAPVFPAPEWRAGVAEPLPK